MMMSDESMINILKEEVVGLKAALKFTEEENKLLKKHYEKSMSSLSTKLAEFEELLHREKESIVKLLQEKDEKISFQKVIIKSLQSEKNVEESQEDGTQHNLSNPIRIQCPLTANQFSSLNISQDGNIVTGKVNELIHSHINHHKSDDFKNSNYALMGIENQSFRDINTSLIEIQEYNLEPDCHLNAATSAEKYLNKFSTQLISSMFQLVNKEILNQSFEKKFQNYIYSFSSNLVCSCIKSATIELGLLSNQPDLKIVLQKLPELNQPNQRNEIQIQTDHSSQLINQASDSSEINYQSEKKPDFYPNVLKTLDHTDLLKNESYEKESKPELHSKIENNLDYSNQIKKQSDIGSKSLNQSDHDNQIKHQLDHNSEIQNLPYLSSKMLNLLDQSDAIKYQLNQPVYNSEMQNQPDFNTEIQTQLDLDSKILNQPDQSNIMKNQLNQFTQPNHNNEIQNQPYIISDILNQPDLSNSIENQLNQLDHSSEIQNKTDFSSEMVNQLKHSNLIDNQLNQADHSYPMKNLLNNDTKIYDQHYPCSELLNQPDLTNTMENQLDHQEHSNEMQKQHGFSSEILNQPDHSISIENQLNQPSHNSETQKQIDFSIEILNQSDHSNSMENQMFQLEPSSEIQDQTDFISEIQNQPDHSNSLKNQLCQPEHNCEIQNQTDFSSEILNQLDHINALENQCNPPDYRSEIEKQQVVCFEMLIELGHCGAIKNPLNQPDYSNQLQNQHLNSEIPKQPDHSIALENQLNQSDHSIDIRNQPDYRNELQKQLDFNCEIFSQLGKSSSIENQLNQPNHSNDKQSQSDLSSKVLKQIDHCYPIEKQLSLSDSNNENQRGCCNEILNYPDLSNETQSTKQNSEHLYATESTSSDSIKSTEEIVINTISSNEMIISNISDHLDPTSILSSSIKMCDNPTEDTFTDGTNDLRKEIVHLVESCLNFVEKILPKKGCDLGEVVNMLPPIDLCNETQDNVGNNMEEFGSFFESEYAIPELSDCSMSLKLDSHRLDNMDNCCHIMNLSTTQMIDTHVPVVNETTTRDLSYSPS